MRCDCWGFFALLFILIATVLNISSLIVPLWSLKSYKTLDTKLTFSAGLWGFCSDFPVFSDSKNSTDSMCFFYRESTKLKGAMKNNQKYNKVFGDQQSACSVYNSDDTNKRDAYLQMFASNTPLKSSQFDQFLKKSCSSIGKASLGFIFLACFFGIFSFLLNAIACCCTTKKWILNIGMALSILAGIFSILSFALWLNQAKALSDASINLSSGFGMCVVAAGNFFLAALFTYCQRKKRA